LGFQRDVRVQVQFSPEVITAVKGAIGGAHEQGCIDLPFEEEGDGVGLASPFKTEVRRSADEPCAGPIRLVEVESADFTAAGQLLLER
jgi:hypothetical protein